MDMNNSSPRISVVMAVYNGQLYLSQTIESICNQTYMDFEFIIVNDNSTDQSLDIINSYAERDTRIKLISNRENKGISITTNLGIAQARGEFIAITDQDDISLPERFEKQIEYFNLHPDIDLCGTAYRELIDDHAGEILELPRSHPEIICSMLLYCPFIYSSVMFRRKVFLDKKLHYDPKIKRAPDYDLWTRAFLGKVRFANLNTCLLLYRIHKEQTSQKYSAEQILETKYAVARLLDHLGVNYSPEELDFHRAIYWWQTENTEENLYAVADWFKKLQSANDRSKLFPEPIFSRILSDYLQLRRREIPGINSIRISTLDYAISEVALKGEMENRDFPKVTVIIPSYNSKRFLKETIDSVFSQTFTDWELLLVDDGSTDGSDQISAWTAYLNPAKVRFIYHPGHKNHGSSATRNLGFCHARGKYVIFLDSDGILLPTKLERHIGILETHPEADALFGETLVWYSWTNYPEDQSKDEIWNVWKQYGIKSDVVVQPHLLLNPLLENGICPNPSSLILRSVIVHRINGWEESFKGNEYDDQAFYIKLFLNAAIYVDSSCLEKYRIHENSMCSIAEKEGKHQSHRVFFLTWAEKYLSGQCLLDERIKQYLENLENILRPYRHPIFPNQFLLPIAIGEVNFGNIRRITPVSRYWGFDRGQSDQQGQPIDRFYIEEFLQCHSADIKGRVLEIGDSSYTYKFGGDRVTHAEVLDVNPINKGATYLYDLAVGGKGFPQGRFDCFILTQTVLLIYDVRSAIRNACESLKPGGVLLVSLPGITRICRTNEDIGEGQEDYWRFTDASARRLFGDVFGNENITVETHGNVLAASAFLFGLASHELKKEELDFNDPDYPMIITVRAIKKEHKSFPFPDAADVLKAQLTERDRELSEIKRSKTWKFALFLRRFRIMVFPPGSLRVRFLKKGIRILISPVRKYKRSQALKKEIALLKASDLFDETWYLSKNPDVAQAKVDPCKHYLLHGGFEGRDPGPNFSSRWYLDYYQDVKNAGVNPLVHYLKHGRKEGRPAKEIIYVENIPEKKK